jgi:hypothetical protein
MLRRGRETQQNEKGCFRERHGLVGLGFHHDNPINMSHNDMSSIDILEQLDAFVNMRPKSRPHVIIVLSHFLFQEDESCSILTMRLSLLPI